MVARGLERCGQPLEKALAGMMHFGHFAMHNFMATHHRGAKGLPNGLMAQTDPHKRNAGGRCGLGQGQTDAGLRGITWAWGQENR